MTETTETTEAIAVETADIAVEATNNFVSFPLKEGKKQIGTKEVKTELSVELATAILQIPGVVRALQDHQDKESLEEMIYAAAAKTVGVTWAQISALLEEVTQDIFVFWKAAKPGATQDILQKSIKARAKQLKLIWGWNPREKDIETVALFIGSLQMDKVFMKKDKSQALVVLVLDQLEKAKKKIKEGEDEEELF